MLKTDPAFDHPLEALFAYPGQLSFVVSPYIYVHSSNTHIPTPTTGIWALWLYRLSHVLWCRDLPWVSRFVPRFAMAMVRYVTAVDIHPAAKISGRVPGIVLCTVVCVL